METITPILEQIRPLVAPLNAHERRVLVQAIATLQPARTPVRPPLSRHQQLAQEQELWFARPLSERQLYRGQFVAVKNGQVIDQDQDQRTLYLRVKAKFGRSPIPILSADWPAPPTYAMHSPHLVR